MGAGGFSNAVAPTAAAVPGVSAVSRCTADSSSSRGSVNSLTAVSTQDLHQTVILRMVDGSGAAALAAGDLLIDTTTANTKHLVGGLGGTGHLRPDREGPPCGWGACSSPTPSSAAIWSGTASSCPTSPTPCRWPCWSRPGDRRPPGRRWSTGCRRYPNLKIQTRAAFEKSQQAQVNQLLGLVYVLLALAIVIAMIGIVNTLMLSVFERTHEIGLLRAVGMRRRQVRSMIRSESVILALFGAIIGVVVGIGLGIAFASSLKQQGITDIVVPVGSLIVFLVLAGLLGLGAASWPAGRAARLNVLAAIAAE